MVLFWRILAAVTLAIFVGLATLQVRPDSFRLVGERLVVLADHTAALFEAAATIGLPLSAVRNATALLERARQSDDAITAIHVFDNQGRIVQSTEASPPAAIPPEAAAARGNAGGAPWHRETAEASSAASTSLAAATPLLAASWSSIRRRGTSLGCGQWPPSWR